jgi:putative tryptophan/tyrosine transport system substrate-binding protein
MITRRTVLLAGGLGLLAAHSTGRGQTAATLRRVALLSGASEATAGHLRAALKQGMDDLGWHEGSNVEYRAAYANGNTDRLNALVGELIEQRAEVIVASSQQAVRAAQKATKTVPIVMAGASNALGEGFVATLANPGGNITGFTSQQEEVVGKLIGILHEVAPAARRISLLVNENYPSHAVFWGATQSACAALDLVALRAVANAPAQLGGAVEQIVRQQSQAVVVIPDSMFFAERAKLQELLQTARLPGAHVLRDHVVAGGLLSYGADLAANYRDAAKYVDRILKGARPADLPVQQTTKFELVINVRTAKALGLTIPHAVLLRADEVIQ